MNFNFTYLYKMLYNIENLENPGKLKTVTKKLEESRISKISLKHQKTNIYHYYFFSIYMTLFIND